MLHTHDFHALQSRMLQITEELSSGCDSDFDEVESELEREFAELRILSADVGGR